MTAWLGEIEAQGAGFGSPPVALLQPAFLDSWSDLGERAGCGLIYSAGGPCAVMLRLPLFMAPDVAADLYRQGVADDFTLGAWRWHRAPLGRALMRQRKEFQRNPDWRREVWRDLDAIGLFGDPDIKI